MATITGFPAIGPVDRIFVTKGRLIQIKIATAEIIINKAFFEPLSLNALEAPKRKIMYDMHKKISIRYFDIDFYLYINKCIINKIGFEFICFLKPVLPINRILFDLLANILEKHTRFFKNLIFQPVCWKIWI